MARNKTCVIKGKFQPGREPRRRRREPYREESVMGNLRQPNLDLESFFFVADLNSKRSINPSVQLLPLFLLLLLLHSFGYRELFDNRKNLVYTATRYQFRIFCYSSTRFLISHPMSMLPIRLFACSILLRSFFHVVILVLCITLQVVVNSFLNRKIIFPYHFANNSF